MNSSQDTRLRMNHYRQHQRQSGAALLVTIVVLLALTVLAIASTNSNQSQSLMVRNNQFRLEAFNASLAEIDGQIDYINRLPYTELDDGTIQLNTPAYLLRLLDGLQEASSAKDESDPAFLERRAAATSSYMTQVAKQRYAGTCLLYGSQRGEGAERLKCNKFQVDVDSQVVDTAIESDQNQFYRYITLAESK